MAPSDISIRTLVHPGFEPCGGANAPSGLEFRDHFSGCRFQCFVEGTREGFTPEIEHRAEGRLARLWRRPDSVGEVGHSGCFNHSLLPEVDARQ